MTKRVFDTAIQSIEVFSGAQREEERTIPSTFIGEGGTYTARSYRTFKIATRFGRIEVTIDVERLAKQIGPKALRNAKRKATSHSGAIVVKALEIEEVPVDGALERMATWIATGEETRPPIGQTGDVEVTP